MFRIARFLKDLRTKSILPVTNPILCALHKIRRISLAIGSVLRFRSHACCCVASYNLRTTQMFDFLTRSAMQTLRDEAKLPVWGIEFISGFDPAFEGHLWKYKPAPRYPIVWHPSNHLVASREGNYTTCFSMNPGHSFASSKSATRKSLSYC